MNEFTVPKGGAMPNMGQPTVDRIDDTHFLNISKYFIRTHPTQAEFKKMIFFYLDGLDIDTVSLQSYLLNLT